MASNRRYERRAAIRSTAKWVGRDANSIPVDPQELRKLYNRLSPGGLKVSRKRISNVKSAVLAAVRAAGILPRQRYVDTFTAEWKQIWDHLTVPEKRQLSRMFRFCSAIGVVPEEFDEATSALFLKHLVEETLTRSPKVVHQNACRRWNGLHARLPNFPGRPVVVPRYLKTLCLPREEFLPQLWSEFDDFLGKMATVDYFDVRAPQTPLKPKSVASYRLRFRMYVSALRHAGYTRDQITNLAFCVRPRQVEVGLRWLLDWKKQPGYEARHSAASCAILLRTIAGRWVRDVTAEDLESLTCFANKLRVRHRGMSNRNRKKVAALKHESNLARLFIMPMKIANTIAHMESELTWSDALLFQKALALVILIFPDYAP